MGRGKRADAAHRTQKTRKYRSGVRSLEDRITLSATPGSGDVDELLTPGAGPDSAPITVQATGVPESTSATTAAWYSSVSSAWFTTLSTSGLGDGGSAVQSTGGSTGSTVDPASYSEWIVRLSAAALETIDSVDEAATWLSTSNLGLSVIAGLGLPGQLLVRAGGAIADVEQFFAGNDAFAYFEANRQVNVQATPNDPSYGQLYGLHNTGQTGGTVDADIDAPEAWNIATGSRSIVVGVIDTGIDWTHPDLAANIWTNPGEIAGDGLDNDGNGFIDDVHGYDFVNNDGNPMDDHYHGTHVAGTIGGVGNDGVGVVGVNWAVSMMGLKFLSSSGSGTTANAVRAVNYATMMRTTYGVNIRMTSNSWGGGAFDQGLLDAINAGGAADILFIAAAGNSALNTDLSPQYPAGYDSQYIVSVAATDHNDALASFSNYGATTVDLAAPGVNTYSTSPGNTYRSLSGTSMATPHVSGVAALALSVDPTLTALALKSKLLENVDVIPGLAGKTATSGRLNAYKVLNSLGLTVSGTTPAIGATVTAPPTNFTLNFNNAYNASTVQASDFTVNGIAASGFTLNDADTITFTFSTSPVTAQGVQTMAMAAGAITRASDGGALAAFSGTFRYDVVPLAVASTTPAQGSLVALPLTTIDIQFNEAINGASIGTGDLTLSQGTVTGATLLNSTTARYTLSGLASEGTLNFTLNAGAVTDAFGNGGAAYSGSFSLDIGTVALPAVAQVGLPGSLAYQTTFGGSIGAAGDEDRLTIAIDAGQHLTVQVDAAAGLTASIEVRDQADTLVGSATAAGAGLDAVLQNLPIGTAGTYTIVVRGAAGSTGTYTVRAILNSGVESENHNGPTNGTLATAQAIDGAFLTLAGSAARASLLGRRTSSSDADWYAFSLAAGQTASVMLRLLGTGTPGLRLTDASGASIALATTNAAQGTLEIYSFTATTAGTYYLEVSGSTSLDYQLVVGRDVVFDRGGNFATASAQTLAAAAGVVGGSLDGGASIGRLYVYDNAASRIREIDETTGATISTFVSPVTTASGPDIGLATTPTSILVGGNTSSPIYELDPNTGAVLRTIGTSGISISGLAYRNGEIFIRTDSNQTITVRDYVTGNILRTFTIASTSESLAAASDALYATSGSTLYSIDPQTGATLSSRTLSGSGTIEGLGVIGNELYASTTSTIRVYDRSTFTLLRTITGQGDLEAIGADGGTTSSGDYYRVTLAAGVAFQARTSTPADGAGEFVNQLDARLSLYDSLGNLVASDDNSAPDGRNAVLNYTPAAGGTYYLVVVPSAPANQTTSRGEYVLEYSGASATAAPFAVASVTPADGANITTAPVTQVTLTFNDGVLLSSLSASDLTVDGTAATSITIVDGSTVRFNLATPITIGTHAVALAAGAVLDLQQTPVAAFSSTFSADALAPRVVASSIQQNDVLATGGLTYTVTFDEAMRTANLDASDFTLRGNFLSVNYAATGFSYNGAGTTLTITYAGLPEDSYTLTLLSGDGRFEDASEINLDGEPVFPLPPNRSGNGTAGGDFVVSFSLDAPTTTLPAVAPVGLAGSLVYQTTLGGLIGTAGDEDRLTIAIDAGQQLSVQLDAAAGLTAQIEVRDPTDALVGTATAGGAGLDAVLQNVSIGAAGTYTIVVRGAAGSTGTYSVRAVLNSAVESENHNGPSNGTPGTAQSIDGAFLTLAGSAAQASVLGRRSSTSDADWYALSLAAGQNVSAMLRLIGAGTAALRLTDAAGTTLAGGAPNNAKGTIDVYGFTAATGGTYYLEVSGSTSLDYQLVVGRNTEFDRGGNIATASAQTLAAASGVLIGNLDGGASIGRLYVYDNATSRIREIDKTTGAALSTFVSPVTMGGADIGLATTPTSILVGGNSTSPIYELDPNTGTVIRTIGASGISISGLAYRNGEIFIRTDSNQTITVRDYVTGNVLRTFTIASSSESLAAASDTLYATSGRTLYSIDPQTGATLSSRTLSGSGTIEGLGVIGNELYASVGSSIQVFDRTTFVLLRTITGQGDLEAIGADGGTTSSGDYYRVTLAAGVAFQARTSTPADGAGQFVNLLDARLSLYDSLGNLVATDDNSAPDGRNALLNFTPTSGGTFYLVLEPSAPANQTTARGEYVLEYSGTAAGAVPFGVAAVTPADGSNITSGAVTSVTLAFNDAVLVSSLAASDLTVDGVAAASFTVVDGTTIRFNLASPISIGTHTISLAAGAILDLQQTPVAAFSSTFSVDALGPRVVASSIQQNDVLAAGGLTYVVTFDEAMLTTNLDASDFTLRGNLRGVNYTASGFAYNGAGTTLTITYAALPEDSYTLTLTSGDGRFEDATGNNLDGEPVFPLPPNRSGNGTAGGDFVVSFSLDALSTTLPAPTAVAPAGSLVYQSSAPYAALIGAMGDVDELTIELDAGQTLGLVATASAALRTSLEIFGPGGASLGTATAAVAGQTLVVQTLPVATTGTYRLRLTGAGSTTGTADVAITLNAALEDEANGGAANNTIATAQSLAASFVALAGGASRGAVTGNFDAVVAGSTTLAAGDAGWYDVAGNHTANFTNFAAGLGSPGEVRSFFVFDLGAISGSIISAQLRLANPSGGYTSPDSTETYALFDVSTPIAQLSAGGTGLTGVFNDLGTGAGYGSKVVSAADNGKTVTVDLNAAAIAMLNAGRGGAIAVGGALTTISGTAWQIIFGSSSSSARELVLTYGSAEPDYYSFDLSAGETAAIGLKHLSGSGATFSLVDAAGNVLASGTPGTGSFDQVVANFTASSAGTYYVAVASSTQATYEVIVTRNAAFDNGANSSSAAAQNLAAARNVLGYATAGAGDYYSFVVASGTTLTLSTSTPGDGTGQFVNGLDPAIELYDASGNLLAANTNGAADGRNALLSRAVAAGTYKARVLATSGQGEYVLQIAASASTPPSIAPISDVTTFEGLPATVEFAVTDTDTPAGSVSVSATAADGSLLPAGGLSVTHLGGGQWRLQATPAADRFGSTTITVQASDGQATTTRQFTLSVAPVNDAPTFVKGADQAVDNTAGARSVAGWATAISPGPNETGQALTFLTSNDNPALFAVPPVIGANGTLTYTLSGVLGTAVVTVRLRDDGGTADGGVDTSPAQSFTITVNNPAPVAPGLDPTFDGDGVRMLGSPFGSSDVGRDVARQADGKYLMLSSVHRGGPSASYGTSALTRFNADGSIDTGFGTAGTVEFATNVRAQGLEIRSDGKIMVGGQLNFLVYSARLNADGTFDASYGTAGVATMNIGLSILNSGDLVGTALQADGKLVVVRRSNNDCLLARFNADGTADTTFGTNGYRTFEVPSTSNNTPKDVVIQSNGKIVIAGQLIVNGSWEFFAARFNADGTTDTTFGASGTGAIIVAFSPSNDFVGRLAVQSDDKIVIAGSAGGSWDFALVRLTADGVLDTSFSGDGVLTTEILGTDQAFALAVQADGKIAVGGQSATSRTNFSVARYLADGTLDTSFDGDGRKTFTVGASNDAMYGLWSDPNGKLVFAGTSSDAVNGGEATIGRLTAGGALDTSFNGVGSKQIGFGASSARATTTVALPNGKLLVGGELTDQATPARSVVWRLMADGSIDTTFGTGGYWTGTWTYSGGVRAMALDADGKILLLEQGGNVVTRLTADGALDAAFSRTSINTTVTAVDLAVQSNGAVVVVGPRSGNIVVVRLTSTGAFDATFDGDGVATIDLGGSSDNGTSVVLDTAGKIVIGGYAGYASVGGNNDFAVVRLNTDGSLDTTFSGDGKFLQNVSGSSQDEVRDLLVDPNGKIVLGGSSSSSFAWMRVLADGTLDTSFSGDGIAVHSPTPGADELRSIARQADGKLLAVGYGFIGSVGQIVVTRYLADGSLDTSFDGDGIHLTPIGAAVSQATASALQVDGKLIVVGHADQGPRDEAVVLRYLQGTAGTGSPSASPIADRTTRTGTATGAIDFTVSHTSLPAAGLTVTVTSGNTAVVPNENLSLVNLGGGNWRLVVTATDTAGTALITVQVNDGSLTYAETFTLTAVPPATVTGVYVRGSGWKTSFLDHLDSHAMGHATITGLGYRVTAETQSLPWSNVDTIALQFDGPVVVGLNDLMLIGSAGAAPPPPATGFVWNAANNTATWTFAAPLAMNKYLLHLDPAVLISGEAAGSEGPSAAAPFDFRFNMLPGDADASAGVTFGEIGQMRNMIGFTAASAGYNPRQDWDGSGSMTFSDVGLARGQLGTSLGGFVDPVAPTSTGGASTASEAIGATESQPEALFSAADSQIAPPWTDPADVASFAYVAASDEPTVTMETQFDAVTADYPLVRLAVLVAAEGTRRSPAIDDLLRPAPAAPVVASFSASPLIRTISRSAPTAALSGTTFAEDRTVDVRRLSWDSTADRFAPVRESLASAFRPAAWRRLRRTEIAATVADDDPPAEE